MEPYSTFMGDSMGVVRFKSRFVTYQKNIRGSPLRCTGRTSSSSRRQIYTSPKEIQKFSVSDLKFNFLKFLHCQNIPRLFHLLYKFLFYDSLTLSHIRAFLCTVLQRLNCFNAQFYSLVFYVL